MGGIIRSTFSKTTSKAESATSAGVSLEAEIKVDIPIVKPDPLLKVKGRSQEEINSEMMKLIQEIKQEEVKSQMIELVKGIKQEEVKSQMIELVKGIKQEEVKSQMIELIKTDAKESNLLDYTAKPKVSGSVTYTSQVVGGDVTKFAGEAKSQKDVQMMQNEWAKTINSNLSGFNHRLLPI